MQLQSGAIATLKLVGSAADSSVLSGEPAVFFCCCGGAFADWHRAGVSFTFSLTFTFSSSFGCVGCGCVSFNASGAAILMLLRVGSAVAAVAANGFAWGAESIIDTVVEEVVKGSDNDNNERMKIDNG